MVGKAREHVPGVHVAGESFRSRTPANPASMLPTTDALDQFAHPGVPEISVQKPDGLIFQGLGPCGRDASLDGPRGKPIVRP
jgi:hypothetical protein